MLHNQPTTYNGILYPSKTEAHYAEYLDKLLKKGKIKWWKRQVSFQVESPDGKKHVIIADFLVMYGREEIHETKFNLVTDKFVYKSQLFLEQYPHILYYVLEPDNGGWKKTPLKEFIKPYLYTQPDSSPQPELIHEPVERESWLPAFSIKWALVAAISGFLTGAIIWG